MAARRALAVNGRQYALPRRPTVAICIDGNEEAYLTAARAANRMPNLDRIIERTGAGSYGLVRTAMPTFTNPNNMSIATGVSPAEHGICGNYFFDGEREVMMNEPSLLRCGTVFAAMAAAGLPVHVVTAKHKLLRMLMHGVTQPNCLGFSAETCNTDSSALDNLRVSLPNADQIDSVSALVGYDEPPHIYDPQCSLFVLEAGPAILSASQSKASLTYLTTSDFVQHKWAPGEEPANDFYAGIDAAVGALDNMGAIVGMCADHGMSPKSRADGSPNVVGKARCCNVGDVWHCRCIWRLRWRRKDSTTAE